MAQLTQVLMLLAVAVTVVVAFQRWKIPSSLGYLLVGLLLGPYTVGPVVDMPQIRGLAEFGIVFLLFTIGLNFSLPQLHALRHQVLGLGTGQVALTTALVGLIAWTAGLDAVTVFVVGAVFAQSSTTIIGKQLAEQGEDHSKHGRLALAMSVFQDVTAVPFVVVIPVLGMAAGADVLAGSLGLAMAKAVLAFVIVVILGRWLLRPLFQLVAARRSHELFTLTVLLVALSAGWATESFGLSMAFGAFLAGMMLGETEFRHQVEATIRPFRDVLLGPFFVGIGMLFDPIAVLKIWPWALLGTAILLTSKIGLVTLIVWRSGVDHLTAWRTGLLLAVGGEFGFALVAIALGSQAIDERIAQIVLTSVLFSMIAGSFLIRFNHGIAKKLTVKSESRLGEASSPSLTAEVTSSLRGHSIICGYGRIGQSVAHMLEKEGLPFVAIDLDAARVRQAHLAGEPVYYGDFTDRAVLEALGVEHARLLVISHGDKGEALKALSHLKQNHPGLPVMVRTRDETHVDVLREAGALEVVPETLEAGLMIASQALLLLKVPKSRVMRRMEEQRAARYPLLRGIFRGDEWSEDLDSEATGLHSVVVPDESPLVGQPLESIDLQGVTVSAMVRAGERSTLPSGTTQIQGGDVLVLQCGQDEADRVEDLMLR